MAIGAAVAGIGAGIYGANKQADAAEDATRAQTQAANKQIALQRSIYNDTTERFAPIYDQGMQAQNALASMYGLAGAPEGFTPYELSDDYQFRMDQGMNALEGSAAASGNVRSGATQKALIDYSQGVASQGRNNWLAGLGSLASAGQAAAGNQANAAMNFGNASSNALSSIGNAQAAGSIAQGNAAVNGVNNALGAGMMGYQIASSGLTGGIPIGGSNSLFGGNSWG